MPFKALFLVAHLVDIGCERVNPPLQFLLRAFLLQTYGHNVAIGAERIDSER